jgi:hypothetical protein
MDYVLVLLVLTFKTDSRLISKCNLREHVLVKYYLNKKLKITKAERAFEL